MEYKGLQETLERFKNDIQDERTELLFKIAYKLGYENRINAADKYSCPHCGSNRTYRTEAIHCNACAITTEI